MQPILVVALVKRKRETGIQMANEVLDLTQISDLLQALNSDGKPNQRVGVALPAALGQFNGTFCPSCGAERRMTLTGWHWPGDTEDTAPFDYSFDDPRSGPALFHARCLQCQKGITILVAHGPDGPEVVALPSTYGGLSTSNTPKPVAFYLDQAQRCQSVGALSGTVAMYRAALEQLLFDQGYEDGMLKRKIDDLIGDEEPPRWRDQLDPAFLEAMKDLGNAAIHPNRGDISKQAAFHSGLLREVRALFEELLEEVYEVEKRREDRLAALKMGVAATKQG
jgi:Domain of unknown function (DUF4145)